MHRTRQTAEQASVKVNARQQHGLLLHNIALVVFFIMVRLPGAPIVFVSRSLNGPLLLLQAAKF